MEEFNDYINWFEADFEALYKPYIDKLNKEDVKKIVKSDPTTLLDESGNIRSAGKYSKWLVGLFNKKKLKLEDLYKATEYLNIFKTRFKQLPNDKRNIMNYKTLSDLYNTMIASDIYDKPTEREKRRNVHNAKDDIKIVFEDANWKVLIPLNHEASCFWGTNTQWCTASRDNPQTYKNYMKEGDLYIIINKQNPEEKYQFHFESQQFMNKNDYDIDIENFFNGNDKYDLGMFFYNSVFRKQFDSSNIKHKSDWYLDLHENEATLYVCGESLTELMGSTGEWFAKILENGYLDMWDVYFDFDDIFPDISQENLDTIKRILKTDGKEISEDMDDLQNLIQENDDITSALHTANITGVEVGTEKEIYDDFNKAIEREGFKQITYADLPNGMIEENGGAYKYNIQLPQEINLLFIINNNEIEQLEDIFDFNFQEPRYGWMGWDKISFNERLNDELYELEKYNSNKDIKQGQMKLFGEMLMPEVRDKAVKAGLLFDIKKDKYADRQYITDTILKNPSLKDFKGLSYSRGVINRSPSGSVDLYVSMDNGRDIIHVDLSYYLLKMGISTDHNWWRANAEVHNSLYIEGIGRHWILSESYNETFVDNPEEEKKGMELVNKLKEKLPYFNLTWEQHRKSSDE